MRYGMTEAPIKILASVTAVAICDNTATPMSATWQKVPDAPVVGFDRATQIQEIEFGPRGLPTWRAKEWKASPALAPLEVLRTAPETLMIVAGVDLYYGENNEFYEKLKEAGVPVVLKEWPRAVHSFLSMDAVLPSGKEAMDCLITFIKEKMTQHFLGSKVFSGDIIDNRKLANLSEQTQDCYR
jgi:acetyl esterase/lipase